VHQVQVPFASLLLDAYNPRHRDVLSQAEAIKAVQGRQPAKLLALAQSICEDGLSPIDRVLVMQAEQEGAYIVLEGNRRIAALKVINNPNLCSEPRLRAQFRALRDSKRAPTTVNCVVVESRAGARRWLLLKHGGELDGAGTVRWSTGQRQRFGAKPGTQEYRALAVLDWLERTADDAANSRILELVDTVFEEKLTTFGRLVTDPDFRRLVGFELDDRQVKLSEDLSVVIQRLASVMEDLEGDLTVTALRDKQQRLDYVEVLKQRWGLSGLASAAGESSEGADEGEDDDSGSDWDSPPGPGMPGAGAAPSHSPSAGSSGADDPVLAPSPATRPRNPRPRPTRLFYGLKLPACKKRTRDILVEAQRLELPSFPNSAAVLTRALIELVVDEAIESCKWPGSRELKDRIATCVDQLDSTGKDNRFKAVRNHVRSRDSIIGSNTMNAYLHNPDFHPTPTELRDTSDNYMSLLEALNSAIAGSSK
jgi:hypothetical protein